MTKIVGIEGLTPEQIQDEVRRGGKFVVYRYCVSVVVLTFRRGTDVHFIRPGENAVVKGLPYTLLSFVAGWWGFPWGIIGTPQALITNLGGGKDVTPQVMAALAPALAAPAAAQPTPGYDLGMDNPW